MKLIVGLLLLGITLPGQAEIYKCTVNGKLQFSDQPCSDKAEVVELKLYQPKAEDINEQQQITQRYKEDSRVNEIESLKEKNEKLKEEITRTAKQWDAEMKALNEKTYPVSDTEIGTREPDLGKQKRAVRDKYQQKIEQLQDEISRNETRLAELSSGGTL